jgi:transcriptional regulator with XRE-family HTH domain
MAARPPREPAESNWSGPDDLRKVFGQNARAARVKAGLTQAQLAERTGLTQQYVSLVEAGHQNITIDTMAALARAVGRDVSALLRKGRNRIGRK